MSLGLLLCVFILVLWVSYILNVPNSSFFISVYRCLLDENLLLLYFQ